MPRPMPLVPPVTRATRPVWSDGSRVGCSRHLLRPTLPQRPDVPSETDATMPITTSIDDAGIAEVVMDNPPVNALTVAGWFELADTVRALGDDPAVRVVVLRAEGRGFNAGVDIKEMQAHRGLRRPRRRQPGLLRRLRRRLRVRGAGDRRRPRLLPRRRHRPRRQRRRHRRRRRRHVRPARGRPGRARRRHPPVPPGAPAQDAGDGVHVGHRDGGRAARVRLGAAGGPARTSCATPRSRWPARSPPSRPTVIRAAKESLNGIDPWDVKRSYRFEQGFTFELNLSGVADEHRDAFVDKRDTDTTRLTRTMADKTHDRGRGRRPARGRA